MDGEREGEGGNGPISTGDRKEHDKQGPLGSFCCVLTVAKKQLHVTPWKFFSHTSTFVKQK